MSRKYKISLGQKMSVFIITVSCLLVIIALLLSYFNYANRTYNQYKTIASNLAKTAAAQLKADKVGAYLETMVKDAEYYEMLENLFKIKNNNDIKFLYVIKIEGSNMQYILDADDNEITRCELGKTVPVDKAILPYIDRLESGVPAYIKNDDTYGWLSLSLEPLINSKGHVTAMVGADISMNTVMKDRLHFLIIMCSAMAAAAIAFIILFTSFIRRSVVFPINQLAAAADDFVTNKRAGVENRV